MSPSTSPSSLLQLGRPANLAPQPPCPHPDDNDSISRTTSARPSLRTPRAEAPPPSSPSTSSYYSYSSHDNVPSLLCSVHLAVPNAIASSSQGVGYLNMPATPYHSDDAAEGNVDVGTSPERRVRDTCCTLLHAAQDGVKGEVMPMEQWQADSSSVLCSYPFCTNMFAPPGTSSYFSLAPRRHHCRLCGLLFCATHTTQRAKLVTRAANGDRVTRRERVCDSCLPLPEHHATSTAESRRSSMSGSSFPSDHLVTPDSEDGPMLSASISLSRPQSTLNAPSLDDSSELAPIESWMGPAGVLSLYPLAAHPSRSAIPLQPSAPPLFTPSLAARRHAREKELARLCQRQVPKVPKEAIWVPAAWGYKREEFDLSYNQDSDGEDGGMEPEGGLVVDGPIRYRAKARRTASAHGSVRMSAPPSRAGSVGGSPADRMLRV